MSLPSGSVSSLLGVGGLCSGVMVVGHGWGRGCAGASCSPRRGTLWEGEESKYNIYESKESLYVVVSVSRVIGLQCR